MTDHLRARLKEDQRIIDAATGGPWETEGSLIGGPHYTVGQAFGINWRQDLIFIAASRTRWEQANQALLAVLKLHRPVEVEPSMTICDECSNAIGVGDRLRYMPVEEWPCPTVKAIQEAME